MALIHAPMNLAPPKESKPRKGVKGMKTLKTALQRLFLPARSESRSSLLASLSDSSSLLSLLPTTSHSQSRLHIQSPFVTHNLFFPESISKGSSAKIVASCVAQDTENHVCTAMHSKIDKSTAIHSKIEKSIYMQRKIEKSICRRGHAGDDMQEMIWRRGHAGDDMQEMICTGGHVREDMQERIGRR